MNGGGGGRGGWVRVWINILISKRELYVTDLLPQRYFKTEVGHNVILIHLHLLKTGLSSFLRYLFALMFFAFSFFLKYFY